MAKTRNFLGNFVTVLLNSTAETAVTHGLVGANGIPIIPRGFIITRRGQASSLYHGATPWTATTAYVRTDLAGSWFNVIFFA